MVKIILTVAASFFIAAQLFAQAPSFKVTITERPVGKPAATPDTIFYNPKKPLTIPDFSGPVNNNLTSIAITSSGFGYTGGMRAVGNQATFTLNVFCYFYKPNSFMKEKAKNATVLKHEQNHFDISYYAYKLFVKQLRAATFTKENYKGLLSNIYSTCMQTMNSLQNQYDTETQNGILKDKQAQWNIKIAKLIK
jgi:hypothetical protein